MTHKFHAFIETDYTVTNSSSEHKWISDEPIALGGEDKGPNPQELFLSSIASCKLITMKMYANRKGYKIDKIEIQLTVLTSTEGTIIQEDVKIHSHIPEDQKKRMQEIGKRCPIAKMISKPIAINSIND